MNNIEWKALSEPAKSLDDLQKILIKNRSLDSDVIDDKSSIKDILQNPKEINFNKEDTLKSVNILKEVISDNKGVVIHGDYDVDGVTSSAILYELCESIGIEKVFTFIPNRFKHGYGFSEESLGEIKEKAPSKKYPLIILTDCGITSIKTVNKAKKSGYKVILIDHHQKKEQIPEADAVFWNDNLTASVLTYFFAKYIEIKIKGDTNIYSGVDFAGLGYVADLGDLSKKVGNIITKEGIHALNNSSRKGVKALLEKANIKEKLTSYDLGWKLGPRLNSSGRMEDCRDSLDLLLDKGDVYSLASKLESINSERQTVTKQMYEEAISGLSNRKFIGLEENHKVVLVDSKNFHEGVIGLISSRLVRSLYKPSISISWNDGLGKGSCRSVEGVNIVKILKNLEHLLEGFGGHKMAAGFSIKRENFDQFKKELVENTSKDISVDLLRPIYYFDAKVSLDLLNLELLNFIDKLEPFGNGNVYPSFALNSVQLSDIKQVGKEDKHLSFNVGDNNLRSIFFSGGRYYEHLNTEGRYDLLFQFKKNIWKGNTYPQLVIKDLKPADAF